MSVFLLWCLRQLTTMPLDTEQLPLISASLVAVLVPTFVDDSDLCKLFKLSFKAWAPSHMFLTKLVTLRFLFTYTFGEGALAPAVLLFVVSACVHISVGLALLSEGNPIKQILKMPIFLAAALAMTLNLSGIAVWNPIYEATSLLGQAAVPIMLLSLGSQMN